MTTVRIARAERRIPPGPVPDRFPTHVIVLADDAGHRELPIWLLGRDSHRFSRLFDPPDAAAERPGGAMARTADELTVRLLRAAGASVSEVDIDELGPEVTVARIGLAGAGRTRHVAARLPDGLAIAITAGAPLRVSGTVLDRLAVPMDAGGAISASRTGPMPDQTARDLSLGTRPRYEPRNMAFASGLDSWLLAGSFTEHASESHWHDYSCAAEQETAVLASAVPQPAGFAFLGQEVFADDYLGTSVIFRGQFRTTGGARRAGLFLRVRRGRDIGAGRDIRGPLTEAAVLADPSNHIVTIAGGPDWTGHEVTARIPDDTSTILFGVFLAGHGRIELRHPELIRG